MTASDSPSREMTLDEVLRKLHPKHAAVMEVYALREEIARLQDRATKHVDTEAFLAQLAMKEHAEVTRAQAERDVLSMALGSLVHRCDVEGVGTTWANLVDARQILATGKLG